MHGGFWQQPQTPSLGVYLASDDPDDPLPQWHWCVEIALELTMGGAPPDKRCNRDLRERQENIQHLPSPTASQGRNIVAQFGWDTIEVLETPPSAPLGCGEVLSVRHVPTRIASTAHRTQP